MTKRPMRIMAAVSWLFVMWNSVLTAAAGERQTHLKPIYVQVAHRYDIPWTLLAAVDRYSELTKSKQDKALHPQYGFAFEDAMWSGIGNPILSDLNPYTIRLFHGVGVDANHDGLALPWDPNDRISALAEWLDEQSGEDDLGTAVWELFRDAVAVERIFEFHKIFARYGLNPAGNCFPIAKKYNYTVKHTFGAGRSYGGRRIHEGVDIFADYGTPVLACAHGYVELMGWNRFGGWRIGIRDVNNVYYYYAHLSAYAKPLKRGDLVEPGEVIGYVGSTGYGPPGTSGKFPPHLHFGMYKDTGRREWAFSPSGKLLQWQRLPQHIKSPPKSDD
ncbi:M23 family metallopeptidase [Alicyclobacillus contaminans]|uniref:M23 family metallopeptidase n=1 Tax=Alicyclobacillus contaminans TaxID=392016 RepID=UPI0003FEF907|nr:M23 family metallopeptidase [Alicyclobacillus contaminans]